MGCHANIIVVDYDQGAAPFAGLEPGDSAESLIARARDNLA